MFFQIQLQKQIQIALEIMKIHSHANRWKQGHNSAYGTRIVTNDVIGFEFDSDIGAIQISIESRSGL